MKIRTLVVGAALAAMGGCGGCGGDEDVVETLILDSLTPAAGPLGGGTEVLLRGAGISSAVQVFFGDAPATSVTRLGSEAVQAVAPAASTPGAVDVRLMQPGGMATLPAGFTYLAFPTISSVEPARGTVAGGTSVLVRGEGFDESTQLTFGGLAASDIVLMSDTLLTAETPPGPAGPVDVTVANDAGESTLPGGFTYVAVTPCQVVEATPTFGQREVELVADVHLRWDLSVDLSEAAVTFETIEGESVPFDTTAEGDDGLTVTPDEALRFWRTYLVRVENARNLAGDVCAAFTSVFETIEPHEIEQPLLAGTPRDVAATGARAYSVVASALQIWELGDTPTLLDAIELPGVGQSAAVAHGVLAVALGYDGVALYDLSAPDAPTWIFTVGTPGLARDVAPLDDGLIAIADGAEGVRIVDISDPRGPEDLAVIDPSGMRASDVRRVAAGGQRVAIAAGRQGVFLYDVSEPTNPLQMAFAASRTGAGVLDVALAGDSLFVADEAFVRHYDAQDPSLSELGSLRRMRDPNTESFNRIAWDGSRVWVAASRTGLVEVLVDDAGTLSRGLTQPLAGPAYTIDVHEGELVIGGTMGLHQRALTSDALLRGETLGWGVVAEVGVSEDTLYAASGMLGLARYSLDENGVLLQEGVNATPATTDINADVAASSLAVSGSELVLGDGRRGLAFYDLSGAEPSLRSGEVGGDGDRTRSVVRLGDIVYECDDNAGFRIFDVSNLESPQLLAAEDFARPDQCRHIEAYEETLYVSSRQALTVIDVSDPMNPVSLSTVVPPAGDNFLRISASERYAIAVVSLAHFEGLQDFEMNRLIVYDVSDKINLEPVFVSPDLGNIRDVLVRQRLLFAGGRGQVIAYDLSDIENPVRQGTIPIQGLVASLATDGRFLYAAKGRQGVGVVQTGTLPDR